MSGNKINKIHDSHQIIANIGSAKESSCEIYVWRFIGGSKHLALAKIDAVRKQRSDFCISPGEGQERLLQELITAQNQLDLYIPSKSILMRCRVKQTDAPLRYYLDFPEFIAQVERRNDLRLNVYEQQEIKVSFGKTITLPRKINQFFMKSCFDVSTGGLSFFVSKIESKLFQANDLISSMELKASDWSAKISAKVVSVRETEPDEANGFPYKVWRVSCQITQIEPAPKKQLERFIFERIKDELRAINQ